MLTSGQEIELTVEKAAAGGRMIARHEGQVVLVAATLPGERVRARVERADKRLAFASTVAVLEPSADRRIGLEAERCGGCVLSHNA
jgi:23S rRNA (uracil1939-C5)-methyltransferase